VNAHRILLIAPLAIGCGSSGSKPDYGELLVIDEALVVDRIERLQAAVPACGTQPASRRRTDGACGGGLEVAGEHANGNTDYDIDFDAFCMSGTEAGDVVLDGQLKGREEGTPSDSGPVVSAFSLDTDGPLAVAHDGYDLEVELAGLRTDYGLPAAWSPDTPTDSAPDVTVADLLTVHFPGGEEPDLLIGDVRLERTGAVPAITVVEGIVAIEGEGHVQVSTPPGEPFGFGSVDDVSGAIVLTGAEGTELVLRPVAGDMLTVELELNGSPMNENVDCSAALPYFAQAFAALVGELPVY